MRFETTNDGNIKDRVTGETFEPTTLVTRLIGEDRITKTADAWWQFEYDRKIYEETRRLEHVEIR